MTTDNEANIDPVDKTTSDNIAVEEVLAPRPEDDMEVRSPRAKSKLHASLESLALSSYSTSIRYSSENDLFNANINKEISSKNDGGSGIYTQAYFLHSPMMLGEDPGLRDYRQKINSGENKIGCSTPKYASELVGRAAIEALRRKGGRGITRTNFLPRTGIWLTMRAPSEMEIINFDYARNTSDIEIGRASGGMLLQAGSGVNVREIVEFALEHVIDTNVKNRPNGIKEALIERIDILDYPRICGMLLSTLYPDGYPWTFICPKCGHHDVDSAVSFARMDRTDQSGLTENQREMLVKHRNSITDVDIAKYKEEFSLTDKTSIFLPNAEITIHFKTCSLLQYITSSDRWLKEMENKYESAMANYRSEKERKAFTNTQAQISRFTKYTHLVDKITFTDEGDISEINDPATVLDVLRDISTANSDFVIFESAIYEFIDANSLAIFGYYAIPCKQCNEDEPDVKESGRFKGIVPLAPDQIFFMLARLITMQLTMLGDE